MKRKVFLVLVLSAGILAQPGSLLAQSSSTSYKVNEATFASGGGVDSNSASYNSRGSVGNLGVGEAGSASYDAFAGSVTPSEEYLELNVTAATIDLGTLTATSTGTGSGTFYVRTYVNGGYVIKTLSNPLTNGSKILTGMSTAGTSTQGTEQFGINLVANTSPATFGANPVKQPNATYANGIAAPGYDTANNFKYVVGDTIAESGTSGLAWGRTDFTISYIANVSTITPGGAYTTNHDIVIIATY